MIAVEGFRIRITVIALLLATAVVWWRTSSNTSVLDLEDRPTDPLSHDGGRATVLIFTRSDCPISNRYAPEVQRLASRFATEGVGFWLVYVDPDEQPQAIERHLADYNYSLPAVRDTQHHLVRLAGARVTPEAAVYDAGGELVYGGRIDNRYVEYDVKRNTPTSRDLEVVLETLLAERNPRTRARHVDRKRAVGCPIVDLK